MVKFTTKYRKQDCAWFASHSFLVCGHTHYAFCDLVWSICARVKHREQRRQAGSTASICIIQPRKRYTGALGGPLTSPLEQLAKDFDPSHPSDRSDDEGGLFSSAVPDSPPPHARGDTIGGTPINLSRLDSISPQQTNLNASTDGAANSNRIRAQSSYGAPAGWNATKLQSTTPPLRMRRTSGGSADASVVGTSGLDVDQSTTTTTTGAGKFVDPLIVRKKERERFVSPRTPVGGRGQTVGELVAFFDGEK